VTDSHSWNVSRGAKQELNHIPRRRDAIIAKIDFRLATMVRDVDVHREQDLTSCNRPSGELCGVLSCCSV
jgi:hypothetical protein